MVEPCTIWGVYRFNDYAALSLSTGKTVYLSKAHALAIAAALYSAAVDIEVVQFQHSNFSLVENKYRDYHGSNI